MSMFEERLKYENECQDQSDKNKRMTKNTGARPPFARIQDQNE